MYIYVCVCVQLTHYIIYINSPRVCAQLTHTYTIQNTFSNYSKRSKGHLGNHLIQGFILPFREQMWGSNWVSEWEGCHGKHHIWTEPAVFLPQRLHLGRVPWGTLHWKWNLESPDAPLQTCVLTWRAVLITFGFPISFPCFLNEGETLISEIGPGKATSGH